MTAVPATFPLDGGLGLVVLDLPSVQERESFPIRPNTLLVEGVAGGGARARGGRRRAWSSG